MNLTTLALLFPTIALLLLAYTNRFLAITQLIRSLYTQISEFTESDFRKQIRHLSARIKTIRRMQISGLIALVFCIMTMLTLYLKWPVTANLLFTGSLMLLLVSLCFSLYEFYICGRAMNLRIKTQQDR